MHEYLFMLLDTFQTQYTHVNTIARTPTPLHRRANGGDGWLVDAVAATTDMALAPYLCYK